MMQKYQLSQFVWDQGALWAWAFQCLNLESLQKTGTTGLPSVNLVVYIIQKKLKQQLLALMATCISRGKKSHGKINIPLGGL